MKTGMSRLARLAVVAFVVAAAVVAFLIARPDAGRGPIPTATTPDRPAPPKPRRTAPAAPRIVVRGGRPVGGVKRIRVRHGETVRFTVTSDVGDEVHVHGYDITREVRAGRSTSIRFRARIDGVFEVELHSRRVTIAELRVTP
jgi:hypothetical protein